MTIAMVTSSVPGGGDDDGFAIRTKAGSRVDDNYIKDDTLAE